MVEADNKAHSRWSRLVSICSDLPDFMDERQLLHHIARQAAGLFQGGCAMAILETPSGFRLLASAGLPVRDAPEPASTVPFSSDGRLDDFLAQLLSPAHPTRCMKAPLESSGEQFGLLVVADTRETRPFSGEEEEMLALLANWVAVALTSARARERAASHQQALARIAAALAGEVEVGKVAQTAVDLSIRELGASGAAVWRADTDERILDLLVSTGYGPEVTSQVAHLSFDSPSLAALAARSGRLQVIASPEEIPEWQELTRRSFEIEGLRSTLVVPLVARGRLMGVLGFARREAGDWDGDERGLVTLLGDLLAAAILNAQLFEESERRRLLAEAVVDNSPVAISLLSTPDYQHLLVNSAYEELTGYRRGDRLGSGSRDGSPGSQAITDALDRVWRSGENVAIPVYRLRDREISALYAPLRSPHGEVEAIISLMLDITEQQSSRRDMESMTSVLRAINEELVQANMKSGEMAELAQQRAAELGAILSSMVDAVLVFNPEGEITLMNGAARESLGELGTRKRITLSEYILAVKPRYPDGKPIPRKDLSIHRALKGEVIRGMEQYLYDYRSHQDRYVLVSSAPVRDERGRFLGAVTVRSDITLLKELDLLKDQFITVAAHEIKTPITVIKGYAQALTRSPGELSSKHRRALEAIVKQSDRIDRLMREFQEASILRWGQVDLVLERLDLTALVTDVVARRARSASAHKLVTTRRVPAWVAGDRERLEQVLMNLLDNAIRFSPQGGTVEVQVLQEGGNARVLVKDRGVGIPKDRQEHVFQRFYRAHLGTHHDYGGLGVGLYISRELIRRLGGDMGFESREEVGSTFFFSLPLAEG